MEESECIPDFLVSFEKKDETNYILGIVPQNNDEDYYYERRLECC